MGKVTNIQTSYNGYLFRSRLEARWAVFFDALGLDWEYEVEGFKLPSGEFYLPDFRVTMPGGSKVWYEVKPRNIKSDRKFDEFERVLERGSDPSEGIFPEWAELLSGDPLDCLESGKTVCPRCGTINVPVCGEDLDSYGCELCDLETPCGGGWPEEPGVFKFPVKPHKGLVMLNDEYHYEFVRGVTQAAKAARSARFEHNDRGGL